MKKEIYSREEIVAIYLKMLGFKSCFSTGIHGGYSCGYGKLDECGFWQFPLYEEANKAEKRWQDEQRKEKYLEVESRR